MEEKPIMDVVRGFYNKLNVEVNFACRCNDEQLTDQQKADFNRLSDEIKKRYYGSGLNIPENVQGKRILDIGCGSGSFVFLLSKFVGPTGYVVGIDLTDGLIQTAKEQTDYHCKQWGYDKPNCEFHVLNAEKLDEKFSANEFDIIVSNGMFCLVPDKDRTFRATYKLLKPGGQFYLNDVYAEAEVPAEHRDNATLWSLGTTGAMPWATLAPTVGAAGFTAPYLTCAAPVEVKKEEYKTMLNNIRFACAGWRLFKLDPKAAAKKGPALVTYTGGISDYPDCFPWDVDTTFKKGEGVEVDAELTTILSSIYLSGCFSFQPAEGQPLTLRNQNPFELMDKLKAEGKLPDKIYDIK